MTECEHDLQPQIDFDNLQPFAVGIETLANAGAGRKLQVIQRLEAMNTEEDAYIAGGLCVEIADMPSVGIDNKNKMLDRAQKNWETALVINKDNEEKLGTFSGWSAVRLASLPIIRDLVVGTERPSRETLETALDRMLNTGIMLSQEICKQETDEQGDNLDDIKYLRTLQADISVLLLLTRFQVNHYEDLSMLGVPTLFLHTGVFNLSKGNLDQPWDVSVFTQAASDQPFELKYRLRVRTKAKSNVQLSPLVVPVYVRKHLKIADESKMPNDAIIVDLLKERQYGDDTATERLDEREYLLLETIG